MKISIQLTVDVDPKAWLLVGYGGEETLPAIREDVRQYVYNSVQGLAGIDESGAVVTLKESGRTS